MPKGGGGRIQANLPAKRARATGGLKVLSASRENRGWLLDPQMGWGPRFTAGVETVALEGDHFTVFQSEGLAKMAENWSLTLTPRSTPDFLPRVCAAISAHAVLMQRHA